jgi:citrate lyase subunit beta/citryl-CoA lyase
LFETITEPNMPARIPTSYLFVPGHRPERFAKACASGAGAVIIDLEDAVAPSDKESARAAVKAALSSAQPLMVRINGAESPWFRDDVDMCREALQADAGAISGIVLPKAERPEDIAYIIDRVGAGVPILPLVESARGMWNVHALASANGVQRLVFGSIDFQADLNIAGEDEELLHFRSQLVLVSRVAGIEAPVDGVTAAIDDPERLRADTQRARSFGFGAKLCIHPKQVEAVNAGFRPSEAEVHWARRVVEIAAQANGAAVALDGKMVDKPVILRAEAILAQVG